MDLLVKHFRIEPATPNDLSNVQLQNSLKFLRVAGETTTLASIPLSDLPRAEKLRLAENVDLSEFKRYTCLICTKVFVQRKRDGRLRLVRHLEITHGILVSTKKTQLTDRQFEEDQMQTIESFSGSADLSLVPLDPESHFSLDRLFESQNVSFSFPARQFSQEDALDPAFLDYTCKLISRSNIAALFFSNIVFKEELGMAQSGSFPKAPHLPSVLVEKCLAASNRIKEHIAGKQHVALTVDYFEYGKNQVQAIMVFTLDDSHVICKRLISFKAVTDDQSKTVAFQQALTQWNLELKVLSVTKHSTDSPTLTNRIGNGKATPTFLEQLFPLEVPSFNYVAEKIMEALFHEDLRTSDVSPIGTSEHEPNLLRTLVLKLKSAINFIKENPYTEKEWINYLQDTYGWLASDTNILLWNGAHWTDFCDVLSRASRFINPMNAFLQSHDKADMVFGDNEIEALGLILNLTLPLCNWVRTFASDTIQLHNYLIHLKKVRLLLAYMSICDLFVTQVPEASRFFEFFVNKIEGDRRLFKFLLLAYLLSGCFSPYEDDIFIEMKQDLEQILSSENDFISPDPLGEVAAFFACISSPRKVEALPEEFWRLRGAKFPNIAKIATAFLIVRPATLSLTTKAGGYVLNHLRSPRHISRSESLLILAMEDDD